MANPIVAILGPLAAANAAAIVASNTPAGPGNLAQTSNPYVMDNPRQVLVTYGNEAAARLITISGLNRSGNPTSQQLTVPAGAAGSIATANSFATVTAVTVYAAWTAAMSVGTNSVASTDWFSIDWVNPIQIPIGVIVTGTANYTCEHTYDDFNMLNINTNPTGASVEPQSNVPPVAWPDPTMVNKTTSSETIITTPYFGFRITLNSGTGSIKMAAIEAGYKGS